MASCSPRALLTALLLSTSMLMAQQPKPASEPKFDVVSIRLIEAGGPTILVNPDVSSVLPGGQYVDRSVWLSSLIAFAYDVTDPSLHLLGLPKWASSQTFTVAAKAGSDFPTLSSAENREQVRLMMRAMLADRFHLQLHTEMRKESVLNLEVAKGGLRIREAAPPVPPAKEGRIGMALSDRGGRMIGNKSTIAGLVGVLTMFLKQSIIDQTGLNGFYDFDVKWTSPATDIQPSSSSLGAEGLGLLISTLQDQFGLSLKKATGTLEYWVVDHVEMPTPN